MLEKTFLHSKSWDWIHSNMDQKKCYVCGKEPLSKDEIGLTKKLIDKKAKSFYCISCMAEELDVTAEELLAKIEDFKNEGCKLFS